MKIFLRILAAIVIFNIIANLLVKLGVIEFDTEAETA